MYEHFTDGIFTICRFTPGEGPFFEVQVVTSEFESDELAKVAAKMSVDLMYSSFLDESQLTRGNL